MLFRSKEKSEKERERGRERDSERENDDNSATVVWNMPEGRTGTLFVKPRFSIYSDSEGIVILQLLYTAQCSKRRS